jgi:hypothetical protein
MNLFHPNSDKNKFGYYEVGDYRTYSKYDAIVVAETQKKTPTWNFNDAVFSCYDWTREPPESLLELYRRRAEQLRNKYDYLVLAFSGGSDSHNVLMSFIKNGIHIDELMTYHTLDGNRGDRDSFQNAEVWRVAKPYGELLQSKYPGVKHRFVDLTPFQFRFWKDHPEAKFDFIYYGNACASIQNICRADLRLYIDDYREIIESGKKLGIIFAVDKPEVRFEDGQWSASFYDIVDHSVPANQQMYNRETDHSEFFYWSPDLPELVIKQCHEIKKYFENPENVKKIDQFSKVNQWGYEVTESHVWYNQRRLTNDQVKTIIYPYWSLDTFSNEKSLTGILFTKRDEWFYSSNHDETEIYTRNSAKILQIGKKWFNWFTIENNNYKTFEQMLKGFVYPRHSQFGSFFKNEYNKIRFPKGYKIFNSKRYNLNNITPHANNIP